MGKKFVSTKWVRLSEIIAEETADRFRKRGGTEVLNDAFFVESVASWNKLNRVSNRLSALATILLIALLYAEVGERANFSILGLSLDDLTAYRGSSLLVTGVLFCLASGIDGNLEIKRKALMSLCRLKYGELGDDVVKLKLGITGDFELIDHLRLSAGKHLTLSGVGATILVMYVVLTILVLLAPAIGGMGIFAYLLYQEWLYPSVEGVMFWVSFLLGAGTGILTLMLLFLSYSPIPFKDYSFVNKWYETRKYDEAKADKMMKDFLQ